MTSLIRHSLCLCLLLGGAAASAQELSLRQAVDSALKNNLQPLLAKERVTQARGEKAIALSALLPQLSGAAYQANLTSNLAAMGLTSSTFPGLNPFVGPFSRFDARLQLAQNLFHLAAIRNLQAGRTAVTLAGHQESLVRQQVAAATAMSYIALLEAQEGVEAAKADLALAQRLAGLARSRRTEGIATGVDVARAETRLATQQMRLAQAETRLDETRLDLLRLTGSSLSAAPRLTDPLRYTGDAAPELDAAIDRALDDRAEVAVAKAALDIATLQRKAAQAQNLPSFSLFGDYGSSGNRPDQTNLPTRTIGVRVDVPIFNGGRTLAEGRIASSKEREADLRARDLRAAIEKDVHQALDQLRTRAVQVEAATQARRLAERELELAQDRFQNGIGDNVEVLAAQTALENARQGYLSSLALYQLARLNLASATGHVDEFRL